MEAVAVDWIFGFTENYLPILVTFLFILFFLLITINIYTNLKKRREELLNERKKYLKLFKEILLCVFNNIKVFIFIFGLLNILLLKAHLIRCVL